MATLDDLKKLPPHERIERLKKIRAQQEEEQKKAEKLLEETETEAEDELRKSIDESFEHLEQTVAPLIPEEDLEGTVAKEYEPDVTDDHPSYGQQQMENDHYKPSQEYDPSLLDEQTPQQSYDSGSNVHYSTSSSVVESIQTETDKITKKYENTDP